MDFSKSILIFSSGAPSDAHSAEFFGELQPYIEEHHRENFLRKADEIGENIQIGLCCHELGQIAQAL